MDTKPPTPAKPRRTFSKPFNPIGAIIEYLHIVVTIMVIVVAVSVPYVILKKKPSYSAEGLMNINPYLPKVLYGAEESNFIHSFEDWMRTQVKVITSYPILEWAIKDYESQGFRWRFPGESMQSAVGRLAGRLKVVQIRDTQLITISYESSNSRGLAEIINSVIKGYLDSIDSHSRNEDNYKLELLRKERTKVQKELNDGYRQLEEISLKYGTAITEEKNLSAYFEALGDLKKTYNRLVSDRVVAESRLKALKAKEGTLKGMPFPGLAADRVGSGQGLSPLFNQIHGRIQETREQMIGLTEDNPRHALLKRRVREMESQVERLQAGLKKEQDGIVRDKLVDENSLAVESARSDIVALQYAERFIKQEIGRAQKEILSFNTAVLRAQTKRQEIQRLMETLNRINARTDQITMEFGSPGRVTVTSWALKPEHPNVDPRRKMLPICFVVALLAGAGVALAREMSDSRIKRPADVEKMLGFPMTGFVLRADEEHIPAEDLYALHLLHPRSFMTQQIAEIVVRMDRERQEFGSKVFAFCGLGDGCGVTMLAMNILAMTAAPRERRLYIDLNTRNPAGSSEALHDDLEAAHAERLPAGFLDGTSDRFPFSFYPCDPQQRMHLSQSTEDLKALLEELRGSFDMIVLDLPPVLLSADTQAIVPLVDVAVLVGMARHSLWGELIRSVSMLEECGARTVSVVLNRVGFVRGGYLRKTLQAYHTLGRADKRRLFGPLSLKKLIEAYLDPGRNALRRLFVRR